MFFCVMCATLLMLEIKKDLCHVVDLSWFFFLLSMFFVSYDRMDGLQMNE